MLREFVAAVILIPHKVDYDHNPSGLLTNYLVVVKLIALRSKIMLSGS